MDQENSLKKGPWSVEEDQKLIDCVKKHGQGNWQRIPREAGLNRCGKSCRLRWTNYLKPGIKRGGFSEEEEATIISLHKTLGNKWSRIAAHLPRRTDNEIKNYWNTHLRKKLLRMGVDPKTHRQMPPDHHLDFLGLSQALNAASLLNMNVNPFDAAALTLQAANANDLIKIQILQNIMQLVNPSPLPYVQNSHAQFNRFPTGANSNFTNLDPMMPDFSSFSALLLNQQPPSSSNSFPWSQGEILPGPTVNDNVKGSGSAPGNINVNPEHSLPSLVSITPESSTLISPPESNQQSYISSTIQPDVFDAWENLVDEEADSSFWKNILG